MKASDYKKGDYVICIDTGGWAKITLGEIYKVVEVSDSYIRFRDDSGQVGGWLPHRFKNISKTLKSVELAKILYKGVNK